ncbi:MAG TPA: SIS domain-containing protein [Candidatus Cloacimonadota bacterium]|nr:SIS domain-containing protein [Candidatus Cloacimonadota bacterium]HPT73072.1 SIS domain-containing protein [Candidatus Cloacimonadota bacterium]
MNRERLLRFLESMNFTIRIPIFGIGCGVLGLSLTKTTVNMGKYASTLLKALEYRGYDSTGAAFQDDKKKITLLKDVGAPSTLVKTLGIEKQEGKIFCGQVRWATFGNVTQTNAQPHEVKCKRHMYGAHNGNITNTRELKAWLVSEGHTVLSDNDGEMVVHTVEHYFDIELDKEGREQQKKHDVRRLCMRRAIIQASSKLVGSFAAVVVDPETEVSYAIKSGSSLYFGVGELEGQSFGLASSDLTAILRFTKLLVKLREGEFIEFVADQYQVYAQKDLRFKKLNQEYEAYTAGEKIESKPVRSKLRAEDTELLPEFHYFMEQEIYAQPESTGKLIKLFQGGSNTGKRMIKLLQNEGILDKLETLTRTIIDTESYDIRLKAFNDFMESETASVFLEKVEDEYHSIFAELVKENFEKKYFFSNEKNTFIDLVGEEFNKNRLLTAKALDAISEAMDVSEFNLAVDHFLALIKDTILHNRLTYTIACGTSFHATKVAAIFFNEIARIEIIPILPGDFRGEYSNTMKDHDLIMGVSQSGETKDLIDIFDDIDRLELNINKVVLVNNMNSTLGQEKSDVAIPILCGPEIAVPATKSYMNQLALFYYLAVRSLETKIECLQIQKADKKLITELQEGLEKRYKSLYDIPLLLKETIETTVAAIEQVAHKVYMEPSMHILATKISGVAMEGALKIRETVLNHAEGREASEFKHGPNTILGKNTVFGMKSIKAMVNNYSRLISVIDQRALEQGIPMQDSREIIKALGSYMFTRIFPFNLSKEATALFKEIVQENDFFEPLYRNYPLVYVTGPDERDINLTISQINTHKIRGADTFIIAEENEKLRKNASATPDAGAYYGWGYIPLPSTGDCLMTVFSSSVVLQLLALRMSVKKMNYLDRLGITDHGVHPDVPKNVSKSITVD